MSALNIFRSALVIGRRDFTATVFSKTFLFFLIGPLFPILIGVLFGGIGASVASKAEQPVVAVIASDAEYATLEAARNRLSRAMPPGSTVRLVQARPDGDPAALTRKLLDAPDSPALAVLSGAPQQPRLTGSVDADSPVVRQLELINAQGQLPVWFSGRPIELTTLDRSSGKTSTARTITAQAGQVLLFLLTLLLAGMLLSQLIEEKSNKVIEVLAAAVPVEAIFLGKLFAMLCVSLLGIAVWAGAAITGVVLFADSGVLSALPPPALGWPGFIFLSVVYFTFGYLLIGGAFLGIGAQASTVREVQTLSMPITMSQVVIFAIAAAAVGNLNGPGGIFAAAFPLSSPYAMLARAALDERWWPHLLAIGWQIIWLTLILRFAAAFFRRSVLKSGPQRRGWFRRKSPAASNA
jgi:ABC-2 type transport system permease protein